MELKIVFMGSPEFAVPTLNALAANYQVVGVVTQPDRPAGRGRAVKPPSVRLAADSLGLAVIQPPRLRQPEALAQLQVWAPDLIIVAAFGQILRPEVLNLPRLGCINVHASLLPRWRGAAPINAAILNGDAETGVTIMCMDTGIDTGPILSRRAETIRSDDTALNLSARLANLGANLLLETLPAYLNVNLKPMPQEDAYATYAPMLKKEDGALDFQRSAAMLERQVRAYIPWPGAYMDWMNAPLKVLKAHIAADPDERRSPGERTVVHELPAVRAADSFLALDEVQPAGKRPMSGYVFLQGARGWA